MTTPGNGFKKPQGILKNKSEEPKKSGDLTGYIQRDKVQKILAKQRQVRRLINCLQLLYRDY